MTETRTTNHRIHVEFCYQDHGELSVEQYIELVNRILPDGAAVTVREHTGYCVAGDSGVRHLLSS